MGQFRVTVTAVGNHGCQRDEHRANPAMVITGCGQPNCTDCITREYLARLRASGGSVEQAHIHHWPGQEGEVLDNLITQKRTGSF
jgi:hypothetical protein